LSRSIEVFKKERILEVLQEIEILENFKIIYACESGSKAWGFASEDSDNDIRFIYVRRPGAYFTVKPRREVIDRNKGDIATSSFIRSLEREDLDFVGFDISKVMELISKGNPALAEWLYSPIVYMERPFVISAVKRLAVDFFKKKAGIYHYEHMARKNFTQYIINVEGDVIVKKYLYVLRPLYVCEWIMRNTSVPPMEFDRLIKFAEMLPSGGFNDVSKAVASLLLRKKNGEELGKGPHIHALDDFCQKYLDAYKEFAETLNVHNLTNNDYERLDSAFFDIVCK